MDDLGNAQEQALSTGFIKVAPQAHRKQSTSYVTHYPTL